MVKIGSGGSKGLGPNNFGGQAGFQPRDPLADIRQPLNRDSDAPGVSFFSAVRAVAKSLSLSWFDHYDQVRLGDYLEQKSSDDPFAKVALDLISGNHPSWLDDRVLPQVLAGSSSLGEPVPISGSPLGQKILAFFAARGIEGFDVPAFAVGGRVATLDSGTAMTWLGAWGSEFGTRLFVRLEIRQDSNGVEWCYVHTNLAVATRLPLGLGHGMSKYVAVARNILPQLFIAETPFPSTMASMSRQIAYPDVPGEFWPIPLASIEDFEIATFVRGGVTAAGDIQSETNSFPKVLKAGFAVSAESEKFFDVIIPAVVDACSRLVTITEDGFRNYREPGADASFDFFYGSEYVYFDNDGFYPGIAASEGVSAGGYARWIPEPFLGELISATDEAVIAASQSDNGREILEWVLANGAGGSVASAINTLCFSYLMPQGELDAAATILGVAIDMDVNIESTNALCNLGQVRHMQGNAEEAKEKLHMALNRDDKFAEAEACFHLGRIFFEEGDRETAKSYWERGAKAEETGPHQEEYAGKCRDQLRQTG